MTLHIDRRLLLKAGTFGLGALALPGSAAIAAARGFTHNVASGEPSQHSVLLWTRYVPQGGGEARLDVQLSKSMEFDRVVAGGSVTAMPARDHCAKLVVDGLDPYQCYYYRFVAPDGTVSPTGRTRTLPDTMVAQFKLGVFSCANLPFGWFNAYAHAADRDDIDLMVHLGDYLYEYERGKYPDVVEALAGRIIDPTGETVALADYRLRFAAYRADADLQALHQRFAMVAMWDDHESANDAWENGAENHQPASEGDWGARKRAAMQAYREWMPVSDDVATSYRIGELATIFRPDTRLAGRSAPLDLGAALAGQQDIGAALVGFRDGAWSDPSRTLLGAAQEAWLGDGFKQSRAAGTRWQILAQQVVMGSVTLSPQTADWVTADASQEVRQRTAVGLAAAQIGLPFNFDMWDGFPAARRRLLTSALDADANLIVLSGDTHNAWAFDLDLEGTRAGVEFAGHSVTSPGYESYLPGVNPADIARNVVEHNPQLIWADTSRRGYMTVTLTPDSATGEYLFMDTIRQRSTALAGRHVMTTALGSNRLA